MQNLKKSVMLGLVAVFGAALAIAPAHAQSRVAADIPFNFVLGKTTMQAGQYRIARSGASFVAVSAVEGKTRFAMLLPGGDSHSQNGQPYLVFTRYGQETFLSKVVFSENEVYDVPVSSREKEMRAHLTSGEQLAVLIQPVR